MIGTIRNLFVLLSLGFYSGGIAANNGAGSLNIPSSLTLSIKDCQTGKGDYRRGDVVRLSFTLLNNSAALIKIKSITVRITDLNNSDSLVHKKTLAGNLALGSKYSFKVNNANIWIVPVNATADPYGIFIEYTLSDGTESTTYQTFFRVVKAGMLTTFDIQRYNYHGLTVFGLDGGMSAEYAVEKAGESLAAGMSHSWKVNGRGSGPNQVFSTPQFLENAVKETVGFYNSNFGSKAVFNSVIISTGIPSVPYLARAMKAPVLPLHFLVSANTVREIQTILDYADKRGYSSYGTLGYDGSVPNAAVAWIKLLDIPKEYLDFLKQHQVRNVIMLGATGSVGGEATAKKVISLTERQQQKYAPGSVFILYPQGGVAADQVALKEKVRDFGKVNQQTDFVRVADWESGIIPEQIKNFSNTIHHFTRIKDVRFITAKEDGDLYKLATYVTLAFIHKNIQSFSVNSSSMIQGVILNPYLISNPLFESYFKYIPMVYWQGNAPKFIISGLTEDVRAAISAYFPQIKFQDLNIWLNSSLNFGGAERANELKKLLSDNGLIHIRTNDYTVDEIWGSSGGMNSPCEVKAKELMQTVTPEGLKKWDAALIPLTPLDLIKMSQKFPSILITTLN